MVGRNHRNNPTKILKIPIGLYKNANQKGFLGALKFYYKVKSLNIHGSFHKLSIKKQLRAKLNLSLNTISKYLKELLELGFANYQGHHFCLIGYDKLWNIIGYNKNYRNSPKVLKTTLVNFEKIVYIGEIKENLRKQNFLMKKNYIKEQLADSVKDASKKLKKYLLFKFSSKVKSLLSDQVKNIRTTFCSLVKFNSQVTLTCESLANLFGYKSSMQGCNIQKKLEQSNMLNVFRQKPVLILSSVSLSIFKALDLDSSFYFYKNRIFKRMPNLISVS